MRRSLHLNQTSGVALKNATKRNALASTILSQRVFLSERPFVLMSGAHTCNKNHT